MRRTSGPFFNRSMSHKSSIDVFLSAIEKRYLLYITWNNIEGLKNASEKYHLKIEESEITYSLNDIPIKLEQSMCF